MASFVADLLPENVELLELREKFRTELKLNPELIFRWFRPCKVRVLIVTDGGLDFSLDDFGLATFVRTLLDTWVPARFEITLGHLSNVSGAQLMDFDGRIKARIPGFKFDDPAHFDGTRFDVVFLFGIAPVVVSRSGTAANGQPYPNDTLAQSELQILADFQNGGGGLFATGDHGALGRFMGQNLPRARNMRLWDSTSANPAMDEVSMAGPRRNDTNRLGDAGSQFDDQSDDIPQPIKLKMYTAQNWLWKYSFPHPLLCGPDGPIKVMPDHPHEGECIEPPDANLNLSFTAPAGPEYPPATDGGPRPLPEIISTNSVLAGTTSGGKAPTVPHSFGGICAYDGHRAGIGRVVTDATWHHFVNINLIGQRDVPPSSAAKGLGFLATAAGQAHLQNIKAYYRNLGVWLSRKSNIRCMNHGLIIILLKSERVMEATLTSANVRFDQVGTATFALIGQHARDVLGKFASRCQSRKLIIDLIWPEFQIPLPEVDPWWGRFSAKEARERGIELPKRPEGETTWINLDTALDVALGAALTAVNEKVMDSEDRPGEDEIEKLAVTGARRGLDLALKAVDTAIEDFRASLRG